MMASWETLPVEIMTDILARLSVRSLIKLRMVSKVFFAIIKEPSFVKFHLVCTIDRNKRDFLLAFHDVVGLNLRVHLLNHQISFPHNTYGDCEVQGMRYGLVLIISRKNSIGKPLLILWNPATRKLKELPPQNFLETESCWSSGKVITGFGYDKKENDFKVIQFLSIEAPAVAQYPINSAVVYSVSTGAWKLLEYGCLPVGFYIGRNVQINRFMFWLGLNYSDGYFLLSFDFSTEAFTVLTMPMSPFNYNPKFWRLGRYGKESLALLTSGTLTVQELDIWALAQRKRKADGYCRGDYTNNTGCWMKMHTFRLQPEIFRGDYELVDTVNIKWHRYVNMEIKSQPFRRDRELKMFWVDVNGKLVVRNRCIYLRALDETLFPVCKDEM